MPIEIKMPRLSDTMEEGRVVEWKKKVGETVEEGDLLCVIETDKADVEFESFYAGTLVEVLVQEGESAPLGAPIAIIAEAGEETESIPPSAQTPRRPKSTDEVAPGLRDRVAGEVAPAQDAPRHAEPQPAGARIAISPLARRLAEEHGVALDRIAGSGPDGRIVKADVEAAIGGAGRPATRRKPGKPPQEGRRPEAAYTPVPREALGDLEDLSPMRRTIAKRMAESWQTAPHFTLTMRVDMTHAEAFRHEQNRARPEEKLSINDLIVSAAALALKEFPAVNASFEKGRVRLMRDVNVGVAVAVDDGLITPVIRNADRKRLVEIAAEARDLARRGRARKLRPDEYTGGSFTISNLGMFGVEEFAAIMNPPEGAILAVGAVIETPVFRDGKVEGARLMKMTLSCDHRIIDGALGARFLAKLKELLENPALLTL